MLTVYYCGSPYMLIEGQIRTDPSGCHADGDILLHEIFGVAYPATCTNILAGPLISKCLMGPEYFLP